MEQIVIIKQNGTRVPIMQKGTACAIKSATQTWTINADDTLNIVVTSVAPQDFAVGDRVQVFGRTYKLNRLPKVKKTGANEFEYTLGFEGAQYDLSAVTFDVNIDTTNNALQDVWGDSLTGNLRRFMDVLVANANRVFPNTWSVGTCITTAEDMTLTFGETDNCLSVLQTLCTKFNCEFEIVQSVNDTYTINMVEHIGQTLPYTFKYGRGRGLYQLTRDNVTSSNIITRLKVYGSTENITSKYRADRLCLPGCTKSQSVIQDARMVARYGVYEGKKYFDIKPTFTGQVEQVVTGDVLSFIDTSITFDLNAKDSDGNTIYLLNGQAAKVHFNTGNLAGYEFDIHSYDHATHKITLLRTTDDRGMQFPSDTSAAFRFGVGNKYKLLNIALPQTIIDAAESLLETTAVEYYEQNCQPRVQYGLTFEKLYLERTFGSACGTSNVFTPGDYVHIVDEDIAVDKNVRVKSIQRDVLDDYNYTLTISDTLTTAITNRVLAELTEIEKIIQVNRLADVARAKRNWQVSRELLSMIFDTEGNYYSEKIAPLSIETQMLAAGAKSQQFTLGITFYPNYNANANSFAWEGGVLTHFTIEDNPRSWTIPAGQFNNLSNEPLYLYVQCSTSTNAAQIILTNQQYLVDAVAGYYTFLAGLLSGTISGSDNRSIRLLSLTYGTTTINGRTIQTGMIRSSGSGQCYFDLDNDEIGGIIKFVKTDGTTGYVRDVDNNATEAKNYINNVLPGIIDDIQDQLDGQIEQFFYTYDPTLANAPASDWTTTALKESHLGDLFYNTTSGAVFRFVKESGVYKWQQLSDAEVAQALALANDALALARTKRRIFTTTPTPPYEVGDLWVQGSSGDIMRCKTERLTGSYTTSDWEKASKYTDNTALNTFIAGTYATDKANLTTQIDGKIESWFSASDPSTAWTTLAQAQAHAGDLWYNTTSKRLFRWVNTNADNFEWKEIENKDAIDAMTAASNAQDTADGKRRVFLTTPYPPYDVGDLWLDGTDLRTCVTPKNATQSYNINDWDIRVGYDNTKTTIDGGLVTSGTIQVAGDNTNVLAGMTGQGTENTSVRFWAGASQENRNTAPFRVLQDGTFHATKGNITGVINANTGSIGGFNISAGCIGTESSGGAESGNNLTLMNSFIKFADSHRWASIGTNVLPASTGVVGVGRFTNTTPNTFGYNYGLLIDVQNATYNVAISANGIIRGTNVLSKGFANITPAQNTCHIPGDLTIGGFQRVLAHFVNSNSGIGFPSRNAISSILGIGSSTPFMFRFLVIVAADSTQSGYVRGRNTEVPGMSSTQYPQRLNNNASVETGKFAMAKGDVACWMLVFDGTNYYAYWESHFA